MTAEKQTIKAFALILALTLAACTHDANETIGFAGAIKKEDLKEVLGYDGEVQKEVKRQLTGAVYVNFFAPGRTAHLLYVEFVPVDDDMEKKFLVAFEDEEKLEGLGTRAWIRKMGFYKELNFFLPGDKTFVAISAPDKEEADIHAPLVIGTEELVELAKLVMERL